MLVFFLSCKERIFNHPLDEKSDEYIGKESSIDLDSNLIVDLLEPAMSFIPETCQSQENSESLCIDSFYIQKTEVTIGFYKAVVENYTSLNHDSLPVTQISWFDAIKFCNTLSDFHGLSRFYQIENDVVAIDLFSNGYRLPYESEWEVAYSQDTAQYYWDSTGDVNEYEWYSGNSNVLQKVGLKKPNPYGLYDLAGNSQEWVNDWYGEQQGLRYGPGAGTKKIFKGGSYTMAESELYKSNRGSLEPLKSNSRVGFRLARSARAN